MESSYRLCVISGFHREADKHYRPRNNVEERRPQFQAFVITVMNLIFIDPCIVIYSYSTTNKMHLLSQIIYSCKSLYMFRTVFPFIIRSSKLRIQQRYMSNSCCCYRGWDGISQIIYSSKSLYMFQTVFPFIIRSSKLHIQQWYMSNSCCYLLLSRMRWNCFHLIPNSSR